MLKFQKMIHEKHYHVELIDENSHQPIFISLYDSCKCGRLLLNNLDNSNVQKDPQLLSLISRTNKEVAQFNDHHFTNDCDLCREALSACSMCDSYHPMSQLKQLAVYNNHLESYMPVNLFICRECYERENEEDKYR